MRTKQLLLEVKTPLRRALTTLEPHFAEIESAWRKKLATLDIDDDAWKALVPMMLRAHQANLERNTFDTFRRELEEQAKIVERSGISEANMAAAFAFYLECCLPYLLGRPRTDKEGALALTRLISVSQRLSLASYASAWVTNWRKMQERERHSISRDLHDDIGHNLLVLKLYLEMMAADLKKREVAHLESKLEEALALVSHAVDSVRRLMLDMGPAMLAQFGFLQAMKIYARQFTLRTGVQIKLEEGQVPANLPPGYETAIYRVLQGALSNIVKHSDAKHVTVTLGTMKRSFFMSIEDDGVGFDLSVHNPDKVFGLTAMRERVETIGGRFHIESVPLRPGVRKHGTRIEVDLPLDAAVD
jgi:signal transduction histidine kinase